MKKYLKATQIWSAFPGTGKSFLFKQQENLKLILLDSDSSLYSWIEKNGVKERNPNFPANYISHICENIGKVDIIMVSTHKEVRDVLDRNNLSYTTIFPYLNCKEEYIERYRERGSSESFIKLVEDNWETWIQDLEETSKDQERLKCGEYLTDLLF